LKILERRVLDNLIWEIDVQGVFKQGETGVDRAIVPSKFPIRGKVEDPASYPILGLLPNCIDIIGAGLVEPALAIRFGILMQTGSKSVRREVIDVSRK